MFEENMKTQVHIRNCWGAEKGFQNKVRFILCSTSVRTPYRNADRKENSYFTATLFTLSLNSSCAISGTC
jgi:hypothetical protein